MSDRDRLAAELLGRMESLFAAVAAKDLAGIQECYLNAPSLLVFLEGPRTRNVGWASIKIGWQQFLDASMELQGFEWGEDLLIRARGEAGFVAATNRYHWRIVGREVTAEMRGTWVMERIEGSWRIVHEHGSFPHPDPYGAGDWSREA
jgi:ketosteroid isomerase-like protein